MAEVVEMYSWKHSSRPEAVWRGGRAGRRCRRAGGPSWPLPAGGVRRRGNSGWARRRGREWRGVAGGVMPQGAMPEPPPRGTGCRGRSGPPGGRGGRRSSGQHRVCAGAAAEAEREERRANRAPNERPVSLGAAQARQEVGAVVWYQSSALWYAVRSSWWRARSCLPVRVPGGGAGRRQAMRVGSGAA